jgi:hypothetical protein
MLFARTQFHVIRWNDQAEGQPILSYVAIFSKPCASLSSVRIALIVPRATRAAC